jgi:hypothetical protein
MVIVSLEPHEVLNATGRVRTTGVVVALGDDSPQDDAFGLADGRATLVVRTLRVPGEPASLKPRVEIGQRVEVYGRSLLQASSGRHVLVAEAVRGVV